MDDIVGTKPITPSIRWLCNITDLDVEIVVSYILYPWRSARKAAFVKLFQQDLATPSHFLIRSFDIRMLYKVFKNAQSGK